MTEWINSQALFIQWVSLYTRGNIMKTLNKDDFTKIADTFIDRIEKKISRGL